MVPTAQVFGVSVLLLGTSDQWGWACALGCQEELSPDSPSARLLSPPWSAPNSFSAFNVLL